MGARLQELKKKFRCRLGRKQAVKKIFVVRNATTSFTSSGTFLLHEVSYMFQTMSLIHVAAILHFVETHPCTLKVHNGDVRTHKDR